MACAARDAEGVALNRRRAALKAEGVARNVAAAERDETGVDRVMSSRGPRESCGDEGRPRADARADFIATRRRRSWSGASVQARVPPGGGE